MANSILQAEKKCYITGDTNNLHEHHIFGGSYRKLSEKYGLKIWLRADWHNMSNYGIHFNTNLNNGIRAMAQKKAMEHYGWDMQKWLSIFTKNYIE